MSKIDYQALREKAEKATCGVWSLEYGEGRFDGDDALIHREAAGYIPICRIEGAHPESRFYEDFQMEQQANAEFIAAANPATVLALLDERERNQQYIKSRDQENEDIALTVGRLRVELEAAKSKLNEQREYYEGVISDGCKRIAELEAREVQLPTRYDLRYGHPINADERQVMIPKENGSWLYLIDLEHALRVADIRIKGDAGEQNDEKP
ncbi:TPA: ead/Ea22-like family protein [Escherichia coli]|nr:ead/Ea22-like family protein [Escherichia coli]HBI7465605.1 ead/Ea22-like family protein [Escherichia coli]